MPRGRSSTPNAKQRPAASSATPQAVKAAMIAAEQALASRVAEMSAKIRGASATPGRASGGAKTPAPTPKGLSRAPSAGSVGKPANRRPSVSAAPVQEGVQSAEEIIEEVVAPAPTAAKSVAEMAAKAVKKAKKAPKQAAPLVDRLIRMVMLGLACALSLYVLGSFTSKVADITGLPLALPVSKLGGLLPAPSAVGPLATRDASSSAATASDSLVSLARYTVLAPVTAVSYALKNTVGEQAVATYGVAMEAGFIAGAVLAALGDF